METPVCKLCLEAVTNFLCPDCLYTDIFKWLESKKEFKLMNELGDIHRDIKNLTFFDTNYHSIFRATCLKCRNMFDQSVCPCCYAGEIFDWLDQKNKNLAKEFEKLFNFDFYYRHGYVQTLFMRSVLGQPLTDSNFARVILSTKREKFDINFCDSCENVNDLKEYRGEFICDNCADSV